MNRISKKAMTTVPLALIALLSLGTIAGCSRNADDSEGKTYITVKGSDTMVHLASTWAESFMEKHPDIEVSVTGGGSGTGIAALLNGTTDLCAASREIKKKELQLAQQKGLQPQEFVAARDGIAVIVNHKNPVSELTLEQLEKIFTGDFERWNQAGGSEEGILVLSRESSSGTYVFFQERVLQKKDYTPKAKLMPAREALRSIWRTYHDEAGSSPTCTTAIPGAQPFASPKAATSALISFAIVRERPRPSRISAVISPPV